MNGISPDGWRIDPAPERGKRTTWRQFLGTHWEILAAADFFTVEVWGLRGLVTFYVVFVIELASTIIGREGLENRSIEADGNPEPAVGPIRCSQRLGGMLSFYHHVAAWPS